MLSRDCIALANHRGGLPELEQPGLSRGFLQNVDQERHRTCHPRSAGRFSDRRAPPWPPPLASSGSCRHEQRRAVLNGTAAIVLCTALTSATLSAAAVAGCSALAVEQERSASGVKSPVLQCYWFRLLRGLISAVTPACTAVLMISSAISSGDIPESGYVVANRVA